MHWPNGSHFCLECQGNHTEPCLAALQPRKQGYAWSVEGESGYTYAVYSRAEIDACGGLDLAADELASSLTGWSRFESGPGRAFGAVPRVKIGRRNVLVTQFRGLDI